MNEEPAPQRRSIFLRLIAIAALTLLTAGGIEGQWIPPNPVAKIDLRPDGIVFGLQTGALRVQVCTDSIIHITYSPVTSFANPSEYLVTKTVWPEANFTVQDSQDAVTLSTARVSVAVNRHDATIAYSERGGRRLVQEGPNTLTPVTVNGEKTYHAEAFIGLWGSTEAFYGLGQHQSGVWNYHGESVDIAQDNTNIG